MDYSSYYSSSASAYQDDSGYGNNLEFRYPQVAATAVAMAPHQRNLSSQSYSSYDSGYGSESISSTSPWPQGPHQYTNYTSHSYEHPSSSYQGQYGQGLDGQDLYGQDQYTRSHSIQDHHEKPKASSSPRTGSARSSNKKPKCPSSKPSTNGPESNQHICLFPRCDYSTLRPFDLNRHQANTHLSGELNQYINCPEQWCGRYGKPEPGKNRGGFKRLDHFREHVRNLHHKVVVKDGDGGLWVEDAQGKRTAAEYELLRSDYSSAEHYRR